MWGIIMSENSVAKPYNPFLVNKMLPNTNAQFVSVLQKHKMNAFSERLNDILTEKSALKIDYHEVKRDLTNFGFPIKQTQASDFHSSLDTVRLKAGLNIMNSCFSDMFDETKQKYIPQIQRCFQDEVCKVFELLSRDYIRLSDKFSDKLRDNKQINIVSLENDLKKHIEFYNHFTTLLTDYLSYITGGNTQN